LFPSIFPPPEIETLTVIRLSVPELLRRTLAMPDGREAKRLEQPHLRCYQSIFGEFQLPRAVYGTREGQEIEFAHGRPDDSGRMLRFQHLVERRPVNFHLVSLRHAQPVVSVRH
jgi:hypothetical protein